MNVTVSPLLPSHATEAPTRPEQLAGAVLRSLGRSFDGRFAWGNARTLVLGILSFGLWPLLSWTNSLRDYIRLEQQQLWHLAEWVRLQSGHPDAGKLRELSQRIRWRGVLAVTAIVWAFVPVGLFLMQHAHERPLGRPLMAGTYGFLRQEALAYSAEHAAMLFVAWTIGLTIAYALHWLQVQLHAADVRRFVATFNTIVLWEGVTPVTSPRVGSGIGIGSALGGILMILLGGLWGVFMLLAGTAQRRYISLAGGRCRAEAGEAVRMILSLRRPVMRVESYAMATRLCRQAKCRNALSPLAKFCPRCGARAGIVMSQVA